MYAHQGHAEKKSGSCRPNLIRAVQLNPDQFLTNVYSQNPCFLKYSDLVIPMWSLASAHQLAVILFHHKNKNVLRKKIVTTLGAYPPSGTPFRLWHGTLGPGLLLAAPHGDNAFPEQEF